MIGVIELQPKLMCQYDNCPAVAFEEWSGVKLCYLHHDKIRHETASYYNGRIVKSQRYHYAKIEKLVLKGRKIKDAHSSD